MLCLPHNKPISSFLLKVDVPLQNKYLCLQCVSEISTYNRHISTMEAEHLINKIEQLKEEAKYNISYQQFEILKKQEKTLTSIQELITQEFKKEMAELQKYYLQQQQVIQQSEDDKLNENLDIIASFPDETKDFSVPMIQSKIGEFSQLEQYCKSQKEKIPKLFEKCSQILFGDNISILKKEEVEIQQNDQWMKKSQRTPSLSIQCETHNLEIIGINLNEQTNEENRLQCVKCFEANQKNFCALESCEKLKNQLKNILNEFQCQQDIEFRTIYDSFFKIINQTQNSLQDLILQFQNDYMNNKEPIVKQLSILQKQFTYLDKLECIQLSNYLQKFINKQNELELKNNIEKLESQKMYYQQTLEQISKKLQNIFQPLNSTYEKIISQEEQEWCQAIAISNDNKIVITSAGSHIKIYELQDKQLILKQILEDHKKDIMSICIEKDRFYSSSEDCLIKQWQLNIKGEWVCTQTLNDHTESVRQIILNNDGNNLFSCSDDKTIIFWITNYQSTKFQQQLKAHKDKIYCISLNSYNQQLASCGKDNLLIIWKKSLNEWSINQQILLQQVGYRLRFLDNNIIAFQQQKKGLLMLFEKDQEGNFNQNNSQQIVLNSNITDNYSFPIQYCQQKKIILNRHNKYVYIIQEQKKNQYQITQTIEYETNQIYGALSNNGELLIIWDEKSSNLQVFELQ